MNMNISYNKIRQVCVYLARCNNIHGVTFFNLCTFQIHNGLNYLIFLSSIIITNKLQFAMQFNITIY